MRIVDLNVLLYAVNSDAALHERVRAWWEAAVNGDETIGCPGNLTTDAHLAALALTHDAALVSCDADFTRFEGLRWENPLR